VPNNKPILRAKPKKKKLIFRSLLNVETGEPLELENAGNISEKDIKEIRRRAKESGKHFKECMGAIKTH
jgi:hypothetical protein